MNQSSLLHRMFREAKEESAFACYLLGWGFQGKRWGGGARPCECTELTETRVRCWRKVGGREGRKRLWRERSRRGGHTLRLKRTQGLNVGKSKHDKCLTPLKWKATVLDTGKDKLRKESSSSDQVSASLQRLFYSTLIFLFTLCSTVLLILCLHASKPMSIFNLYT